MQNPQAEKVLTRLNNLNLATSFNDTLLSSLKPRPNDRNMSTQHIATLLGATCCARLATMLRRVATCWVVLDQM